MPRSSVPAERGYPRRRRRHVPQSTKNSARRKPCAACRLPVSARRRERRGLWRQRGRCRKVRSYRLAHSRPGVGHRGVQLQGGYGPAGKTELFGNVPAVARDLAVLVDERIPVGDMLRTVSALPSSLLTEVRVFDVYAGSPVPPGRKSVAFGFTFQGEKTLTDEEVDAEVGRIRSSLEDEFGVRIRS